MAAFFFGALATLPTAQRKSRVRYWFFRSARACAGILALVPGANRHQAAVRHALLQRRADDVCVGCNRRESASCGRAAATELTPQKHLQARERSARRGATRTGSDGRKALLDGRKGRALAVLGASDERDYSFQSGHDELRKWRVVRVFFRNCSQNIQRGTSAQKLLGSSSSSPTTQGRRMPREPRRVAASPVQLSTFDQVTKSAHLGHSRFATSKTRKHFCSRLLPV